MHIELVKIGEVDTSTKYPKLELEYIRDGKNAKRKLAGVGPTRGVIMLLKDAKPGDHYEIELEETKPNADGQTFWNWNKATKIENVTPEQKTSFQAKSNYETPEERAIKQLHIARQSSISNALKLFELQGVDPKQVRFDDILDTAQGFVNFIYEGLEPAPEEEVLFEKSKDDIPY